MKTVGPTTNRKRTRITAPIALALDRNCTPFSMPVTADSTKQAVSTQMTARASTTLLPDPSKMLSRPPVICRAPSPSEVAEPKRVAMMATESIALPGARPAASPISGRKVPEMRLPPCLR